MSEKLSSICEETSQTQENFQEECAQELHETYVSFERHSDGASSIIYCTSPLLPPGLSKPSVSIKMGLVNKVKTSTWDRYVTESKHDPNLSRRSKSKKSSRWTPSFFHPNTTSSSSSTSATTSDRDRDREMLSLRERIDAAEIVVERQQQEIAALLEEAAETRSILEELKAQMELFVQSQHSHEVAPALPQVTDLDDLLSF